MEVHVYMLDSFIVMLSEPTSFLYSLDINETAQSSNICIVNCLRGATFDVEQRSSQDVFLLLSVYRM